MIHDHVTFIDLIFYRSKMKKDVLQISHDASTVSLLRTDANLGYMLESWY